ncbi:MAG: hypothetical protein A2V65_09270 [Deltaproteobacteria bacterium RBG_13_49_15]|nr:MAG: hypothetical protein A2V65_09270 [Deltaproteobacteria bacterium RBG_13_49_15]
MRTRFAIHLNLRQKVSVGIAFCIVIIATISILSYTNLAEIEKKVHFVENATDLSNSILEIRRYEKNFLLYGQPQSLEENLSYIQHVFAVLSKLSPETQRLRGYIYLEQIHQELLTYQGIVEKIREYIISKQEDQIKSMAEPLRESGKVLVDLSEKLIKFERDSILSITRILKTQISISLAILLIFSVLFIPLVFNLIIQPLRLIEETTQRIAQGNFKRVPQAQTKDETERVIQAFNHMVDELEKRQEQLLQAKKLSSLGVLTSGVAHQLNNPLNNISSSCQILLEEVGEADATFIRKLLGNIDQEVLRARDIVKGLLEFAREKEFALKPTPLVEVVELSIRLISSQVPAGVDISTQIPSDLVLLLDSQRMQQVFLNLLENALQAIKEPPGRITITAYRDLNLKRAIIHFQDDGKGIPENNLGRIFDPFFTTKEVGVGTGLGLSIVYGIIQKHDGSIGVESKEGQGTRFTIHLPLFPDSDSER